MPQLPPNFVIRVFLVLTLIFGVFGHALAADHVVVVAVIDGGIDERQLTLAGQTLSDLTWNFVTQSREILPQGSHATKVAGIITKDQPNVKLMDLAACDLQGCPAAAISAAIVYAVDHGADIINISLSSSGQDGYTSRLNDAMKYAYEHNVLVVAAAGNDRTDALESPVCNDNGEDMVLGVGSVDKYNVRSEWSNFGKCVDVYYPGENISTIGLAQYDGSAEVSVSGTSHAAAGISGLAAKLKFENPDITRADLINELKRRSPQVLGASTTSPYLIFGPDGKTVYLVSDYVRRGFPTPEVFFSYGYKFSQVGHATATDLALPEGPAMTKNQAGE